MAGSQESIVDLLRLTMVEDDLQDLAEKLRTLKYTVPMLLLLSDSELEAVIHEVYASQTQNFGIKTAIRTRLATHEGVPGSKKPKVAEATALGSTKKVYYGTLLEPPGDLPLTAAALEEFLGQSPVKLPVRDKMMFHTVDDRDLLTLDCPEEADRLALLVESSLLLMSNLGESNEDTISSRLFYLTGYFLERVNDDAPLSRYLHNFFYVKDSANPQSTQTASKPLERLSRPDFQLFVKGCLVLRWENKVNYASFDAAVDENVNKLKVWSTLFYESLPYVIGGCCAGKQFRWLRLVPDGEKVVAEFISPNYDLRSLKNVAAFLHSVVRMHCLLQKMQEKLTGSIKLILYRPMRRHDGGIVTIYPNAVKKEILDADEASYAVRMALYESITGSKYLIQGTVKKLRKKIILELQPVGDPRSKPVTLKELEDATHDILCGLKDLHEAGYTHRDIRWDNVIKVNVKGIWKWILIDLENAGVDAADWSEPNMTAWDDSTLDSKGKKKTYTKASDIYLLGKLICGWLYEGSAMDETGYGVMETLGRKMMRKRSSAVEVKKDLCERSCERCQYFDP